MRLKGLRIPALLWGARPTVRVAAPCVESAVIAQRVTTNVHSRVHPTCGLGSTPRVPPFFMGRGLL
jgi:hypothetical protein